MDELKPHTQRIVEAEIARVKRNANPEGSKKRVAITDQKAFLNVDPSRILIGEIEVYDPRDRSDGHS